MSIIIRSINNSKIELLLNKKNITVSINNDYEKFIIYRDLVLYISLLTISSSSKYSYKDNEKYVEKFINSIACLLNKHKFSIGIGYGYSGIGYMLYVLSHITKKYENLHSEIDKKIIDYLYLLFNYGFEKDKFINLQNINVFLDYFKGLTGILNYLDIVNNEDPIIRKIILELCENLIIFKDYNKVTLGIAHGYSGLLLFLIKTRYLSVEEKKKFFNIIQEKLKFTQYDNLDIRINDLSWGNGKYGYLYVLILIKNLLGLSIENEKKEMFNLCNISKMFTYKKNLCSGIDGCLQMTLNLYKYKLINSKELDKLSRLINSKYRNKELCNYYNVKEMSVINGILAENLVEKLNKNGKKIYSMYFMI